MVLDRIKKANDIKKIEARELPLLAKEIRKFLIRKISKTGGHLAPNLGVVELTMAMHMVFQLPKDKIIWDVGHQAYTHKLLTGRKEGFNSLRKYGGMSGFPKRKESACDSFDTGHSSTSISAGLGYVEAREILGQDHKVISVIGDGSLTGGMAYEALNNAAHLSSNFIIVLNDNHMSISENVGGMSKYLDGIRTADFYTNLKKDVETMLRKVPVGGEKLIGHIRKTKSSLKQLLVPGMFFEDMGITYLGPVDGHNLKELYKAFQEAKKLNNAVLIHVLTKKGKGYRPAQENPSKFHGTGPFDIKTGEAASSEGGESYTSIFGKTMLEIGKENPKVTAITAAMSDGTGLTAFAKQFPTRFFDVGIAEEHGVTFGAGLAAAGLTPVFAVYSSFLQRGYDQLIHDVCLQELPVVFAVDRAGLVGSDGETHQGIFDLSYLTSIPNMTVMSPKNGRELTEMLKFAVDFNRPAAIRYPRGAAYEGLSEFHKPLVYGQSEIIYEEEEIALFAVGHMVEIAVQVRQKLKSIGYNCSLVNSRFMKPIDEKVLTMMAEDHKLFVTIEENVKAGGFGEKAVEFAASAELNVRTLVCAIPDEYVEHGSVDVLRREVMLDSDSIVKRIVAAYVGL